MVAGLLSLDLKPLVGNDKMACALRAATERNSIMLTIVAALETILGHEVDTITVLNLHFISANFMKLDAPMLFDEILHLLPPLK